MNSPPPGLTANLPATHRPDETQESSRPGPLGVGRQPTADRAGEAASRLSRDPAPPPHHGWKDRIQKF